MYLVAQFTCTDFTNDKNTMPRVIWGHMYLLEIKIYTKDNTWNVIIIAIMQEAFAKLGGCRLAFNWKRIHNLVNHENVV